jgi:hypothetical protein
MAIMCGAIGIIAGAVTFLGWQRYGTLHLTLGGIWFAVGVLAIWGSRRYVATGEHYKLAILFGGVCSLVSGMILGIIPLILILISKKEFEDIPPVLRDK